MGENTFKRHGLVLAPEQRFQPLLLQENTNGNSPHVVVVDNQDRTQMMSTHSSEGGGWAFFSLKLVVQFSGG